MGSFVGVFSSLLGNWDVAVDAVDYPVYLKPLFFHHDNEEVQAAGTTNTGRDCEFYGVVVDPEKDGSLHTISTVTGLYETLPVREVYEALRSDLEKANIAATPTRLYISGDGGSQLLEVKLDGLDWVDAGQHVDMFLKLSTSVDGKRRHAVSVAAVDAKTGSEIIVGEETSVNLSARHTKTIKERHAAFSTIIDGMVSNWNDTIIPTLVMLNDCTFSRSMAMEILTTLLEESGVPERHQNRALGYYETATLKDTDHSMLKVLRGVSEYLDDSLTDRPERLITLREKISKKVDKVYKSTVQKLGSA